MTRIDENGVRVSGQDRKTPREADKLPNPDPGAVDRGHEGIKPPGDEQGSAKANPGPVEREPPTQ